MKSYVKNENFGAILLLLNFYECELHHSFIGLGFKYKERKSQKKRSLHIGADLDF